MYIPTARERVKLRVRAGLFLVLSVNSEAQTVDLLCMDATIPFVLEDVPYSDVLPMPDTPMESH